MNPTQRAALRALVLELLPRLGRDGLIDLLARRMTGATIDPALAGLLSDPVLEPVWTQPETLGWAHQYAQEEAKERVFERLLKQGEKVPAGEIPAATQLFTPAWIVRFLVENSLGRLWLEMHPDSSLRGELAYLVREESGPGSTVDRPRLAREIRVLDPGCGTMHFGLAIYDLLARCYAEELERAGEAGWPVAPSVTSVAEIPGAILEHNLYGVDIDPAVLAVARSVVRLKAGAEPVHLYCVPAPLGVLDRETGPAGLFHVVLTNPPYMARKNAEPTLAAHLESAYPEGKGDLYTAFLQRCVEWLAPGGRVAMIAQSSFMFIGSYEALRKALLDRTAIETVAHLGPGAFAEIGGEKVNTAAFVLRREDDPVRRAAAEGVYIRLLDGGEEEKQFALEAALGGKGLRRTPQASYRDLPGTPWIYWLPDELRGRYQRGERLGDHARFCRGITTADNGRFVRYWWEVGLEAVDFDCRSTAEAARSAKRWFPYMKGGGPVRWFGNVVHVLNWGDGGRELRSFPRAAIRNLPFQFREGVTYSSVTGGSVTARVMPPGFLFDQASNALFPHDLADEPVLLALLNHPIAGFTTGFNPTVNIVEADLNRIPWPRVDRAVVAGAVAECIDLARRLDQLNELSPYFRQPPLPDQSDLTDLRLRLAERETFLERLIDEGLGLSPGGSAAIRERIHPVEPPRRTPAELAEAWVSYALGILLGRCRPGGYGGGALLAERWDSLAPLVRAGGQIGVSEAGERVAEVLAILLGGAWGLETGSLDSYLGRSFPLRHGRTYRQRPVYRVQEGIIRIERARPQ
ncbi:MAG: Eco57I restriction-modification methylase domain-containing protein [Bacillota bacterium]